MTQGLQCWGGPCDGETYPDDLAGRYLCIPILTERRTYYVPTPPPDSEMQPVRYRVARYEIRADDRGRRFYVYVDSEDRP